MMIVKLLLAVVFAPAVVVARPLADLCQDDVDYRYEGRNARNCDFVFNKGFCDKKDKNNGNLPASSFCPSKCLPECKCNSDDPSYLFENVPKKTCSWVSKNNKCDDVDTLTGKPASELCPSGCDEECVELNKCEDDPDYRFEGQNKKPCSWVFKKKNERCGKEDNDRGGKTAGEFCPSGCLPDCKCRDKLGYRFKNKPSRSCSAIQDKSFCDREDPENEFAPVSDFCPSVCDDECVEQNKCKDKIGYRFQGKKKRPCSWVRDDKKNINRCDRIDTFNNDELARDFCPSVCDEKCVQQAKCEDTPGYRFEGKKNRPCSWVGKNDKCREKDKEIGDGNRKAGEFCPSECSTDCKCGDDPDYRFKNDRSRPCSWVFRKGKCDVEDPKNGNLPASNFCPSGCLKQCKCRDTPDYFFKNKKNRPCSWVVKNGRCEDIDDKNGDLPAFNFCPSGCLKECNDNCDDTPGYRFQNKNDKTCAWVFEKKEERCDKIDKKKNKPASFFCPSGCLSQCKCQDTAGYLFKENAEKTCSFFKNNKEESEKLCEKPDPTRGKVPLSNFCPSACDPECDDCVDKSDYLFEDDASKPCSWVFENKDRRCGKEDKERGGKTAGEFCPSGCLDKCVTSAPTINPTHAPVEDPTEFPTESPTDFDTNSPTDLPSVFPTFGPTSVPSFGPSSLPSFGPSSLPSFDPSSVPSFDPSSVPSLDPSSVPSLDPSTIPSIDPSSVPSLDPSTVPSLDPSTVSSLDPSTVPSLDPSTVPSLDPSSVPSASLVPSTVEPTENPSDVPSSVPSEIADVISSVPTENPN